ncbi:PAS domain S-box protein [Halobacterium yunchengense]|uniref:PAS domain S-box protein n=1 Tax=Halobacterium yunchengense TaxID=3108497 RepID=UPI0030084979
MDDGRPPADAGRDGSRIALFLDHEQNRDRLAAWVREQTGYAHVLQTDTASPPAADLRVVDPPVLARHREWLADQKAAARPRFEPVLLVRPPDLPPLEDSLWTVVDEVIETPLDLRAFEHRLRNLLERRSLSRDLAARLEATTERSEAVFESVNDAILVVDPAEDTVSESNPRAAETFGYARSRLESLSPATDLYAGDPSTFRAFADDVLEDGRVQSADLSFVRADDSELEAEVSASALTGGGAEHVVLSVRDVTERREQERVLSHQRDRLAELNRITSTLYESIQAVVRADDRDELEAAVCRRLSESDVYRFAWIAEQRGDGDVVPTATGGSAAAYLDHARISADDSRTGRGPTGRAFDTGTVCAARDVAADSTMDPWRDALDAFDVSATAAVPITDGDQSYGVLNLYTARRNAFTDEERRVLAHLGQTIGRAVTGLRATEAAQLFRQAVEHAGHAIHITDADRTIEYANPAFEEVTGYDRDAVVGREPDILRPSPVDTEAYRARWDAAADGDVWESELVIRRKDGRRRYVDQTIAPIFDEDAVEYYVAVNADITEQRRQRQQLEVLYRVLRHNVRNQLNVVDGYAELLGDDDRSVPVDDAAAQISAAADDLLKLSTQARRIEGTLLEDDAASEARPLRDVVEDAVEAVRGDAGDADVSTAVSADGCRVSPELETAVREVLGNAVQHSDADEPTVSLTVETDPDGDAPHATVTVADDGPGIPENERRVLENGRETPLLHGAGLGLWLVNWIVAELGGRVEITDNEPRGTVVTLRIPVSRP